VSRPQKFLQHTLFDYRPATITQEEHLLHGGQDSATERNGTVPKQCCDSYCTLCPCPFALPSETEFDKGWITRVDPEFLHLHPDSLNDGFGYSSFTKPLDLPYNLSEAGHPLVLMNLGP
jgi:hypothetical protein